MIKRIFLGLGGISFAFAVLSWVFGFTAFVAGYHNVAMLGLAGRGFAWQFFSWALHARSCFVA